MEQREKKEERNKERKRHREIFHGNDSLFDIEIHVCICGSTMVG
jgi:hypothetical protein